MTIATKNTPIDQMTSQIQSGIERISRKKTVSRERSRSSVTTTRMGWRLGSGGCSTGSDDAGGSLGGGSKTIRCINARAVDGHLTRRLPSDDSDSRNPQLVGLVPRAERERRLLRKVAIPVPLEDLPQEGLFVCHDAR